MARLKNVLTVCRDGSDSRAVLLTLRDHVAHALDNTKSAREIATLSKRMLDIQAALDELDGKQTTGGSSTVEKVADIEKLRARCARRRDAAEN